jgi:hypothetical protein
MSFRIYYYGIREGEAHWNGKSKPIVFVRRKKVTDEGLPRVISHTKVIEVYESSEPYLEVEELANNLCRAYISQEHLRNFSLNDTPKTKTYYYGVRLEDTPPKPMPFVIRKKASDTDPPEAIVVYESTKAPGELKEMARDLWLEYKDQRIQTILEERVPQEEDLPSPGDVQVGDVVVHQDHEGHHFAVILDIPDEVSAWAVFFSGKVYGKVSRRATKDELALAGFVHTKTTYLNLVYRHILDFHKHGVSFPEHRVLKLRKEFLVNL